MNGKLTEEQIKQILLKETYIADTDLKEIEKGMKETSMTFVEYLLEAGFMTKDILGQALAEHYNLVYANLSREKVEEEVLKQIPEIVAKQNGIIAFAQVKDGVKVAMNNPTDLTTLHLVEKRLGQKVFLYYTMETDLQEALSNYKAGLEEEFKKILEKLKQVGMSREERDDVVVQMVDVLLQYGYQNKSSDIHIEPAEDKIIVRFRIDGVMHDVLEIPKDYMETILIRVKILAKLRTDEHRAAQDGKLRFKVAKETIDVRISIVPTVQGENIVMRILSSHSRQFSLSDLGLGPKDMKKVQSAIKHPHGMFLVTGPTGSGKTTTLYAVLKILNRRDVNIATIEDPVEYDIGGITQIQVDNKTNLTFAKGLRSLVRQDPDIIMVGEIRDEETAGIAINSALTGHLVLSTLHTNDAATTLPRLLDMEVEPFLVASTVNVAIAQRLVRKICAHCRTSYRLNEEEKHAMQMNDHLKDILIAHGEKKLEKLRLYKGAGCKVCNSTGYHGRIAIFEILEMTEDVRQLILQRVSSEEILKTAKKNGMTTMLEDGIDKVLNGLTTLEEVLRVTRD